jgi:hypothetical protein
MLLKQNSTSAPIPFRLVVTASGILAPATGLTPTVTITKNGGSFATPSGAVTEVGNGWYMIAGNATDTNTLGPLIVYATGTLAIIDPTTSTHQVVAFDPNNANLGISNVTANVTQLGGNSVTTTGSVTFPSSVGTSTYAGADTSGTTTLLSRLTQAILFDGSGNAKVNTQAYASGQDPGTLVAAAIVEGSLSFQDVLSLLVAANCGKVNGAGTTTVNIRDTGDTTNRITATVDSNGNRSAVTLNPV